jgi:cyclopropane fatty-acyl-phospholipid synthase-like methyltransferase
LNAIGFKIVEKTILEVGFGHGADLLECKRRGGIVYGLDLNPQAIEDLSELHDSHKAIFRAGVDRIPFGTTFDLIYARDLIYYLGDDEITKFLKDVKRVMNEAACLIIQIIEADIRVAKLNCKTEEQFNLNLFENYEIFNSFEESENPVRYLSSKTVIEKAKEIGLMPIATMRLITSYDDCEEFYRADRYIALQANDTITI